jgi:hypothetical protein
MTDLESINPFSIASWHSDGEWWLKTCEDCWRLFLRESQRVRLDKRLVDSRNDEIVYYQMENHYATSDLPPIVKALSGCYWSFAHLIDRLIPEAGIEVMSDHDKMERAIAESNGWKEEVEVAITSINNLKEKLAAARPAWKVTTDTDLLVVLTYLNTELQRQYRTLEAVTRPHLVRLSKAPLTESGYTRIPGDRINKAVIEALAPGRLRNDIPLQFYEQFGIGSTLWRAYGFGVDARRSGKDELIGVVGLREEVDAETWKLLRKNSHLAVKIHLALWERAYMETPLSLGTYVKDSVPSSSDYVTMTVARLCDDIGLTRQHGAHKTESRETVTRLLKLVTSLELICLYRLEKNMYHEKIRGPIWKRGTVPVEVGRYSDLFTPEPGELSSKPPHAFSYAPGAYFEHPTWRSHNKHVAYIHSSLLSMSCTNEYHWPLMIGAYLSILARMHGYREKIVSFQTLVDKTGLSAVYRVKDPRMKEELEESLDYLEEIGVIKQWILKPAKEKAATGESEASDSTAISDESKKPAKASRSTAKKAPKESATNTGSKSDEPVDLTRRIIVSWPEHIQKLARRLSQKRRKRTVTRGRQK